MDEPKRMYSVVRDREGDPWWKGRTVWHRHEGRGKLPWHNLVSMYGPVTVDAGTDRLSDFLMANRNR